MPIGRSLRFRPIDHCPRQRKNRVGASTSPPLPEPHPDTEEDHAENPEANHGYTEQMMPAAHGAKQPGLCRLLRQGETDAFFNCGASPPLPASTCSGIPPRSACKLLHTPCNAPCANVFHIQRRMRHRCRRKWRTTSGRGYCRGSSILPPSGKWQRIPSRVGCSGQAFSHLTRAGRKLRNGYK